MFKTELPQSDPKLKDAVAEIEAICQKYGIGAAISLASSTHGEFSVVLPQWSGLQQEENGQFRLKLHHTEPEKVGATIHLAYALRDMSGLMFQNFEAIADVIAQKFKIDHVPFSKIWDMDGWQKPPLPATPYQIIDLKHKLPRKNKKPKGFKK